MGESSSMSCKNHRAFRRTVRSGGSSLTRRLKIVTSKIEQKLEVYLSPHAMYQKPQQTSYNPDTLKRRNSTRRHQVRHKTTRHKGTYLCSFK